MGSPLGVAPALPRACRSECEAAPSKDRRAEVRRNVSRPGSTHRFRSELKLGGGRQRTPEFHSAKTTIAAPQLTVEEIKRRGEQKVTAPAAGARPPEPRQNRSLVGVSKDHWSAPSTRATTSLSTSGMGDALHMRLPSSELKNVRRYQVVNLDRLMRSTRGGEVTIADLVAKGAVRSSSRLLSSGGLVALR